MERNKNKRNGTCRVFCFLLLFICHRGGAQTLDLYSAVNKAVTNYPLIKQRQAEVMAGRAHVNTVKGNRLPALVLQEQADLGTNNSVQGSYLTYGMIPSTPGNNNSPLQNNKLNPNNVALSSLQWEFYTFGYYKAQEAQARAQMGINEASLENDRYQLTESVISFYLDWLKKSRLLQVQAENVQRANVLLTAIRATVLSGLKPGVDSSTASAASSGARIAYLQALNDCNDDRITIASYTGLNAAGLVPDTSSIAYSLLPMADTVRPAEAVPAGHPLLYVYEQQLALQKADNNAISKKYLPKVGLEGAAWLRNSGISYAGVYPSSPLDGLPYSKYNYLLGLTVSYNLFDLKHRHDEIVEGRYAIESKTDALQARQITLDRMMQQANASYSITREKLKEIPTGLYAARQAYGQQLALYRAGLNTMVDLTNAQYALLQAETDDVLLQDELLQLLFIRAGLSGQLDTFLQNFKK